MWLNINSLFKCLISFTLIESTYISFFITASYSIQLKFAVVTEVKSSLLYYEECNAQSNEGIYFNEEK